MQGKLIVIEGTDCSGKETQANLLVQRLNAEGIPSKKISFPMYDTPTGKIIGGPFLGKSYIQDGFFPEGAANIEAKVACLYYAADRKYNIHQITDLLNQGIHVIVDRYVESNMAHQGGKIKSKEERKKLFEWIDTLEFTMLELPRPDKVLFLHMPYQNAIQLRQKRNELPDQVEMDSEYLKNSEATYLELVDLYDFVPISCVEDNEILSIETIHNKVYQKVKKWL